VHLVGHVLDHAADVRLHGVALEADGPLHARHPRAARRRARHHHQLLALRRAVHRLGLRRQVHRHAVQRQRRLQPRGVGIRQRRQRHPPVQLQVLEDVADRRRHVARLPVAQREVLHLHAQHAVAQRPAQPEPGLGRRVRGARPARGLLDELECVSVRLRTRGRQHAVHLHALEREVHPAPVLAQLDPRVRRLDHRQGHLPRRRGQVQPVDVQRARLQRLADDHHRLGHQHLADLGPAPQAPQPVHVRLDARHFQEVPGRAGHPGETQARAVHHQRAVRADVHRVGGDVHVQRVLEPRHHDPARHRGPRQDDRPDHQQHRSQQDQPDHPPVLAPDRRQRDGPEEPVAAARRACGSRRCGHRGGRGPSATDAR
jgi:hypothetical protein